MKKWYLIPLRESSTIFTLKRELIHWFGARCFHAVAPKPHGHITSGQKRLEDSSKKDIHAMSTATNRSIMEQITTVLVPLSVIIKAICALDPCLLFWALGDVGLTFRLTWLAPCRAEVV